MIEDVWRVQRRWAVSVPLNRNTADPAYREEWYGEQCGGCRFWCPLSGPLGGDWGVCTNPLSEFDAMVRFEHDGCAEFALDETGTAPFG